MSAAPSFSPRFRPELGLPWFEAAMQGLSPEQIAAKCKNLASFNFPDDTMRPHFPKGTKVVLRPVGCKCKLVVGKVYVLLAKGGTFLGCGRLTEALDSEELDRYGVQLTLHWDNGQLALAPWVWPHAGRVLYGLAYYGSVAIEAL